MDVAQFDLLRQAVASGETVSASEAVAAGINPAVVGSDSAPLSAVLDSLKALYAQDVGAEFGYVEDASERAWLAAEFEAAFAPGAADISNAAAKNAYTLMAMADAFESFVARRLPTYKRYSGEGTEALMPALDVIFGTAAASGVKDIVLGKAHRGRLALLVTLMDYPARTMFWKVSDGVRWITPASSRRKQVPAVLLADPGE